MGIDLTQGKPLADVQSITLRTGCRVFVIRVSAVGKRMRNGSTTSTPEPASSEERELFRRLQSQLPGQFRQIFPDPKAPRTVLIVPSFSLDQEVMSKITGVMHYEERFLCLLLLLRWPRTRVIYVTSTPISESIIDYYLHLLPDVPTRHARRRLTLMCCNDPASQPLTAKILKQPRLLAQLGEAIGDRSRAHMTCFNVTGLERKPRGPSACSDLWLQPGSSSPRL